MQALAHQRNYIIGCMTWGNYITIDSYHTSPLLQTFEITIANNSR
jgi:hypothetical protein